MNYQKSKYAFHLALLMLGFKEQNMKSFLDTEMPLEVVVVEVLQ